MVALANGEACVCVCANTEIYESGEYTLHCAAALHVPQPRSGILVNRRAHFVYSGGFKATISYFLIAAI